MIFPLLLSILMPLFLGFVLVFFMWPNQRLSNYHLLIKGIIATGLGFGISSIIFFLYLLFLGTNNSFFILFEKALFILLIIIFLYIVKRQKHSTPSENFLETSTKLDINRNVYKIFLVTLISALFTFIFLSLRNPHGGWDAWAIWNMRARFIFRSGEHWENSFSNLIGWSHPDYPLFLPLSIAQGWKTIGSETPIMPIVLAIIFTFSIIFLIFSSLTILRSRSQGLLAGLVLLGTPFFIKHGASQYADVPLGFFFLLTIVLLAFYDRLYSKNHNLLFLAGMSAGLTAWTKNEGFLFIISIVVARSFVTIQVHGWKILLKQMRIFFIGLMPILLIIVYFKTHIATANDLISSQGLSIIFNKLIDFSRYVQILKAYVIGSVKFTEGIISLPLLAIYLFLLGIKREERDKIIINTAFIALALMLAGYFFIYVITPYDLGWHLNTSLNRLFLQLWPSFIFLFFMIAQTPEQTFLIHERYDKKLENIL